MGPSAIGRNQDYLNTIFPPQSLPLLSVVANLGLVLYLFVVGMELGEGLLYLICDSYVKSYDKVVSNTFLISAPT